MTSYQIRVYDPDSGDVVYVSGLEYDIRTLNITHAVNNPSTLTLGMDGSSPMREHLTLDALIEVRRRVPEAGLDWYTEYIGFHRTPQRQITETDLRIYTSYSRGLLDLIRRTSIRYYADTDGSAKGPAPADDIIKEYVLENAGSLATTANNRVVGHVYPGLSVAANESQAAVIETANTWRNLLDAIQDIGEANNVDFDVIWLGGTSFQFKTYYPYRGTDRREGTDNPMVFAPKLGNMIGPSHTISRTDEVTSVLVLGPGEGPLRDTTLRTSDQETASPWNSIELDQDARGEDRLVALQNIGDRVLFDKRAAVSMPFSVLQNAWSTYGRHYFLGDIVTGMFDDVSADLKIKGVTINVSGQEENISLELEEYTNA